MLFQKSVYFWLRINQNGCVEQQNHFKLNYFFLFVFDVMMKVAICVCFNKSDSHLFSEISFVWTSNAFHYSDDISHSTLRLAKSLINLIWSLLFKLKFELFRINGSWIECFYFYIRCNVFHGMFILVLCNKSPTGVNHLERFFFQNEITFAVESWKGEWNDKKITCLKWLCDWSKCWNMHFYRPFVYRNDYNWIRCNRF